jgi:hypothetical protein
LWSFACFVYIFPCLLFLPSWHCLPCLPTSSGNWSLVLLLLCMLRCHNPNFGFTTKAKACEGVGQEWSSRVTFHALESVGECEGSFLHTPMWTFTLGSWSPDGLPNLQRAIVGVKSHWIEILFILLKNYWNLDV